jgi:hypothetical protein
MDAYVTIKKLLEAVLFTRPAPTLYDGDQREAEEP